MKNFLESMGGFALFRGCESRAGLPSTYSGVAVRLDAGSGIKSTLETAHDGDTVHGSELPGLVFAAARSASGTLSQKRARPDFIAFVLAYFFGSCDSSPDGMGYTHVIYPSAGLSLPSFTAVQRRGRDVFSERLAGNYIESFRLDLGEDFASLSAEVVGTGARETNYIRESITAPGNSITLTLSQAVAGATAAERLANLYRVRARLPGENAWRTATTSEVSDTFPAMVTLDKAVGGTANDAEFQVDYLPTEPNWCVLPQEADESPLRLIDARVLVDAGWNGTALVGGEELGPRLVSLSLAGRNNLSLRRFPGASGEAEAAVRGGRELTITLTEELRDTVRAWAADHADTETLSFTLSLGGATVGGRALSVDLHFPRCAVLAAPVVSQAGRLSTAADLIVLEDGQGGGGAVIWNQQTGYLVPSE